MVTLARTEHTVSPPKKKGKAKAAPVNGDVDELDVLGGDQALLTRLLAAGQYYAACCGLLNAKACYAISLRRGPRLMGRSILPH